MTRADDRLQRLLIALPTMADEPKLTIEQLASRVGSTAKILRADFLSLDRDDTPPGFVESIELYWGADSVSMRSSHFKRPMRLTRPEVAALELGLRDSKSLSPANMCADDDTCKFRRRTGRFQCKQLYHDTCIVSLPLNRIPVLWRNGSMLVCTCRGKPDRRGVRVTLSEIKCAVKHVKDHRGRQMGV